MKAKDFLKVSSEQPYTPADFVLRGLARISENRLRLRWSAEADKWAVEMKAHRAIHTSAIDQRAHYKTLASGKVVERDSWLRQRDGYFLIGFWDAQPMLADWCISELQRNDMRRLGGAMKVARLLEDQEENKRAAIEKRHREENYEFAETFYYDEKVRQGEVSYVPSNYKVK